MARTQTSDLVTIKKYGNRRLYDTDQSRYITLDELEARIREGTDVRVVDAKSGADLTQATLTQIIIEGRGAGKMLPVPLLTRLIRLGDEALAEFIGRWISGALEVYLEARQGAQTLSAYNPFAMMPFDVSGSLARMFMQRGGGFGAPPQQPGPPPAPPAEPRAARAERADRSDVEDLRRELEELKAALGEQRGGAAKRARSRKKTAGRGGARSRKKA